MGVTEREMRLMKRLIRPNSTQKVLVDIIARVLARGEGVRIGQTTVVSRKLHVTSPGQPSVVRISVPNDAGQVFYHRREPDEIIHMDLFHQVAEVDHWRVAEAVKRATAAFLEDHQEDGPYHGSLEDYIDIQTATGGGRVTGALNYGKKKSVRKAHLNHVHICLLLGPEMLGLLFYLVAEVEQEVLKQGFEIRRVEGLCHDRAAGTGEADLSPYSDYSDSKLRGEGNRQGSRQLRPGGPGDEILQEQDQIRTLTELVEEFDDPEDFGRFIKELARGTSESRLVGTWTWKGLNLEKVLSQMKKEGLVVAENNQLTLTPRGQNLYRYYGAHLREIEMYLRKAVRRFLVPSRKLTLSKKSRLSSRCALGITKKAHPVSRTDWVGDIAVPETVTAALVRAKREGQAGLEINRDDIWVFDKKRRSSVDICLIIDASASMAGERIRAAKFLARHLLLSTGDKVAVMAFQERWATVFVPFTRNYRRIEAGVKRISPYGLTPLAQALVDGANYLEKAGTRNPLILLITDGIPTVPKWTINPLDDALKAASILARLGVTFACIGLEPNKKFLADLTSTAGGTLHIVEELRKEHLVLIAHQQRERHQVSRLGVGSRTGVTGLSP